MGARFNIQGRARMINDLTFHGMAIPIGFRSTQWDVSPEVWSEEIEEPESFKYIIEKQDMPLFIDAKAALNCYANDAISLKTLPQGEYIFCRLNLSNIKTYNPMLDVPDLFLRFATIGKKPYNLDTILEFVRRYGQIYKIYDKNHRHVIYPSQDFYKFALEAHIILSMYQALSNRKYIELMSAFQRLFEIHDIYNFAWDFFALSDIRWGGDMPEIIMKDVYEAIELVHSNNNDDSNQILCHLWDKYWGNSSELGEEVFFRYSAKLIEDIVTARVGSIRPSLIFQQNRTRTGRSNYRFKPSWGSESLLSTMWMQFYLKITGQMEVIYKLCPVCGEPILEPRKNQIYHDTCRRTAHIRTRRLVEKLWREGKTVEEIVAEIGINQERVIAWVAKIPQHK